MNTQHDITVSGKPLNPPKPPAKPHMLLWIDTETTGLDPNQCELLEVGMQVTDLKAETRGGSLHLIVHPDNVRNWANHLEHPITQGLHHRKLDLTSFRLADQAIGGNPYQNHAGTHRVQDCIRRDINDYTAYLDIIRTGTQGDRQ